MAQAASPAEADRSRRLVPLVPIGLFLLALVIRLIGLRWGVPSEAHWYSYHPDERQIVQAVAGLDFFSGDFNPNFFNYPSLYIYLVYIAHFLAGGFGLTHTLPAGSTAVWPLLQDIIVSGRFVTALLGAATVPLVYGIAATLGGRKMAVVAALLMALTPGHVQHSHFATVDVAATFFVALSLWFTVRAYQASNTVEDGATAKTTRLWLLSGLAAGLATATKYNAVIIFVAPLLGIWLSESRAKAKLSALAIVMAALGFLLGCPYAILSFSEFWGDGQNLGFAYELLVHPKQGQGLVFQQTGNGWIYHLAFNLPFAMTAPPLLASIVGIVLACRSEQRRRYAPLLAFSLLYFFALGFSQVRFMRYTLLLLPPLCVFAALTLFALHPETETAGGRATPMHARAPMLAYAGSAIAIVIGLLGTFNILIPFIGPDPRDRAADFLREKVSSPTTVGLVNQPWFWTPPLTPQDVPAGSNQTVSQSPDGRYRFAVTGFDAAALAAQKPEYFVMSELEWREEKRLGEPGYTAFMKALERDYREIGRFKTPVPLELPGRDFAPHDFIYTNPAVVIYQRANAASTTPPTPANDSRAGG